MSLSTVSLAPGNVSEALLEKYNTSGPRYTSYPTVPVWKDSVGPNEFKAALSSVHQNRPTPFPLSLYVHLPFCMERCLFCSCNVVITQQKDQAEKYLGYLFKELDMSHQLLNKDHQVVQFHFGGGTPTYLSPEQLRRVFQHLTERFNFAPDAEIGIEVDPRVTTAEQIDLLKALGFNRISMGVQDFDAKVQEAVHRIQPVDLTEAMVKQCRELQFDSVNFDLIYGLPHQTVDSFKTTLQEVIRLSPDRIALYNFAYVPWISPHQNAIDEATMPPGTEKFKIFTTALEMLTQAGYLYIGMDHFAKPTDELVHAYDEGTLHRNFMGFTTKGGSELYGAGVSAISGLTRHYAQNQRKLAHYYEAIEQGILPTMRGYSLTDDDVLRRDVINSILCRGSVHYREIENCYDIEFSHYFKDALEQLDGFEADQLLNQVPDGFVLTPLGRIFSRNIAMLFDAHLPKTAPEKPTFSKTL